MSSEETATRLAQAEALLERAHEAVDHICLVWEGEPFETFPERTAKRLSTAIAVFFSPEETP